MVERPRELGSGAHARRVRVLTVDDEPFFRGAARALIIATPGFELWGEAASGEEALEFCGHAHPDLVLLDINLPGMDGLETSRRLSEGSDAPVIVLISADDDPVLHELAPELGASVFMAKSQLSAAALGAVWDTYGAAAGASSDRPDQPARR